MYGYVSEYVILFHKSDLLHIIIIIKALWKAWYPIEKKLLFCFLRFYWRFLLFGFSDYFFLT